MTSTAPSVLQERIAARLKELRRSPRDVSIKAGLGPDAIRTIFSGRSRSPRGETLSALADELQCDVAYLLGQQDKPHASELLRRNKSGIVRGVDKIPVMYRLSQEWKESRPDGTDGTLYSQDPDMLAQSNYYTLPDYLTGPQSLEYIEDDHAEPLAPRGAYLHTLSLHGLGSTKLNDNDLVIVSRMALPSDQKTLVQRSCRRFRLIDDRRAMLDPVGARHLEPPIRLEGKSWPAATGNIIVADGQSVMIEALVLRAISVLSGPDVFAGWVAHKDPATYPVIDDSKS